MRLKRALILPGDLREANGFRRYKRNSKAFTIWVAVLYLPWHCSGTLQKYLQIFRVSFLI